MIGGAADIVDVAGPQAFLASRGEGEIELATAKKWSLNWFIPAGVKRTEGSHRGTSTSLPRRTHPFEAKKARYFSRNSSVFMDILTPS